MDRVVVPREEWPAKLWATLKQLLQQLLIFELLLTMDVQELYAMSCHLTPWARKCATLLQLRFGPLLISRESIVPFDCVAVSRRRRTALSRTYSSVRLRDTQYGTAPFFSCGSNQCTLMAVYPTSLVYLIIQQSRAHRVHTAGRETTAVEPRMDGSKDLINRAST